MKPCLVTYRFLSVMHSFYRYHPLGFAYYPDGALDDKPEIEDESLVVRSSSMVPSHALRVRTTWEIVWNQWSTRNGLTHTPPLLATLLLPFQYLINGVQPAENLDGYEPEFFFPREAWQEKNYTVQLTITPEIAAQAQGGEIFYFCHIHAG